MSVVSPSVVASVRIPGAVAHIEIELGSKQPEELWDIPPLFTNQPEAPVSPTGPFEVVGNTGGR